MENNRPIGVIDSGLGGLSVVMEMIRQLPNEQMIYLGDSERCPYGPRDAEEVRKFTQEMVDFLWIEHDIKMLVIACNTATAFMLEDLRKILPIPVLGVIHPGARAAIKKTTTKQIGVIGTSGTIASQAYEKALHGIDHTVLIKSLACPEFVVLAEKGCFSGEDGQEIVSNVLGTTFQDAGVDTLILGCTHYPLLAPMIQHAVGEHVHLISSGEETAREVSTLLHYHQLERNSRQQPHHFYYTTGSATAFQQLAERWMGAPISVAQVSLQHYVKEQTGLL
ncbi:glutamate racemase [Bacillaceae bacterium SIJ1]|uniref:glutamate racemase n=1 Tax=Litoribacterium kuwaitense TaxID=1398745 RepID=UPI0013EBCA24|nr:glutamate racemase [Litoribacterium kuwaitense]NGP44987.1 glutamate racemase [Litoribacterium kuwaitense]